MQRPALVALVALVLSIVAVIGGPAKAQTAISAEGVVESTTGGFKFPDATTQTTAMPSGLVGRVEDLESLVASLQADAQNFVRLTTQSRTIAIPADYASLEAALTALQKERIAPGVAITLQLAAGVYPHSQPLILRHPDGAAILILGNTLDPSTVVLNFVGSSGLLLDGSSLGMIDGVTVQGDQTPATVGVRASAGAVVTLGGNVVVDGFDRGVEAGPAGVVNAAQVTVRNNAQSGFSAHSGGVVNASESTSLDNGGGGYSASFGGVIHAPTASSDGNGGNGYEAFGGGTIAAFGASAAGNSGAGFLAASASTIQAVNATAEQNDGNGFAAFAGGNVVCLDCESTNNGAFGYHAGGHSVMEVTGATASANTFGDFNLSCNVLSVDGSILLDSFCP